MDITSLSARTPEFTYDWQPTEPYVLHPTAAEMVGEEQAEEYIRLLSVWRDNGWACRDQIVAAFDKRADYAAIRNIGKKRAPLMAELMKLPYEPQAGTDPPFVWWTAVTGIPVHCNEDVAPPNLMPPVEAE